MLNRCMPGAVLLGGGFISLGAARMLARHGVSVTVIDPEICVSQFSRSVQHCFHGPPTGNEPEFLDYLENLAEYSGLRGAVLFPTGDDGVKLVSKYQARLSQNYRTTLPDWAATQVFFDKRFLPSVAQQRQVPIPETHNPGCLEDLDALDFRFPVVLKPAVNTRFREITHKKAYRADNRQEMLAIYAQISAIIDPHEILVQEFIPGGADCLFSYFGYFKAGKLVVGHSAKRPRQDPMDFGRLTTFAFTVDIPELEMLSIQLFAKTDFSGMVEVEFMYDARDARYEMIEVNPRLWGWSALAGFAGVDLPYLVYADAIQQDHAVGRFRDGVKWMRLTGDLPTVSKEILAGRLTLPEYLSSIRGARDAVFSFSDPLPMLAEIVLAASAWIGRLLRR
jgi:D-aspartate ligase